MNGPFSILERIVVGETYREMAEALGVSSFSILERIVVGETDQRKEGGAAPAQLSVSSNGSLWVKLVCPICQRFNPYPFSILERIVVGETQQPKTCGARSSAFQYPRTDRCG